MSISDEAVDVARRSLEREFPHDANNEYIVRLALEAAAPLLMAAALQQAAEVASNGGGGGFDDGECDDWSAWLRRRAEEVMK